MGVIEYCGCGCRGNAARQREMPKKRMKKTPYSTLRRQETPYSSRQTEEQPTESSTHNNGEEKEEKDGNPLMKRRKQ